MCAGSPAKLAVCRAAVFSWPGEPGRVEVTPDEEDTVTDMLLAGDTLGPPTSLVNGEALSLVGASGCPVLTDALLLL